MTITREAVQAIVRMTADYANWTVEFYDTNDDLILEESFVGVTSPGNLSRIITQKLDTDPRLANVAGWEVHVIAVDN